MKRLYLTMYHSKGDVNIYEYWFLFIVKIEINSHSALN